MSEREERLNDEELARFLALTPEEAAIIIPKLSPEKRATYDAMYAIERWDKDFGELPSGVILCFGKDHDHG